MSILRTTPLKVCQTCSKILQHGCFSPAVTISYNSNNGNEQKQVLKMSYQILQVEEESDLDLVRESYLKLAKQYHPDSGSKAADSLKFAQIEEAYRTIVKYQQNIAGEEKKKEELGKEIFDIRHTAPQHRQYLNYEGVGFGTPSTRARQYEQYRVSRASENVMDYRTSKIAAKYENSMVIKDKVETRKKRIQSAIDRLVEDLIAESMARGDFDNLPGMGKPLPHTSYNPMVDTATHNLNRILIENGYAPEWVTLQKEINTGIKQARNELLQARIKSGVEPISAHRKQEWDKRVQDFTDSLEIINQKVNKLNMIVPALHQQVMPYTLKREIGKILDNYQTKVENGEIDPSQTESEITYKPLDPKDQVGLKDIIKEIKALFHRGH